MKIRARLLGHSIHQLLVVFPLGLLGTAVVFDLINLATGTGAFHLAAYWMIAAGVVGGVLAAPFGFIDWLGVPKGSRARRIGAIHGSGNAVVLVLFATSWLLRRPEADVSALALALPLAGAALALLTAWLGAELVFRLGVGRYDHSGADAPGPVAGQEKPLSGNHAAGAH